jgi:photosystem II stability/assembly factor-like uncharacterized protein
MTQTTLRSVYLASALIALLAPPGLLGAQWQVNANGTDASLRGLSAANGRVAWATGARGTFVKTADGGKTWTVDSISGAAAYDLRSVHARSERTAHVAATAGRIWRTTDGGKTWSLRYQAKDTTVFLDAIDFWDDRNGIALGDPMNGRWFILLTRDGGTTWTEPPMSQRPVAAEGEAAFAASGSSLVTGEGGTVWIGSGGRVARLHRSNDYGRTWSVLDSPLRQGGSSEGIFSLAVESAHVFVVGGDYQQNDSTRANAATLIVDPGPMWRAPASAPRGYRSGVALYRRNDRETVLICTGPGGTDISTDLGVRWISFDTTGFHSVRASRDGVFFASGSGGRVAVYDARGR